MDIIVTALSVVFSGVVATVITILYQKFRSVYKELHADHETGTADNK